MFTMAWECSAKVAASLDEVEEEEGEEEEEGGREGAEVLQRRNVTSCKTSSISLLRTALFCSAAAEAKKLQHEKGLITENTCG